MAPLLFNELEKKENKSGVMIIDRRPDGKLNGKQKRRRLPACAASVRMRRESIRVVKQPTSQAGNLRSKYLLDQFRGDYNHQTFVAHGCAAHDYFLPLVQTDRRAEADVLILNAVSEVKRDSHVEAQVSHLDGVVMHS